MARQQEFGAQVEKPKPGEKCPCCGRKMPGKKELTPEAIAKQRDQRKEYNQRPDVIEKRKEYHARRREEIKEALRIAAEVKAAEAETEAE